MVSFAEERFEWWRKTIGLFAGPVVFLFFYILPTPSLSWPAHRLGAILGLILFYWITEAIPIPVTALLGPILCIIFGVAPAKEVLAPFADPVVFLFIGSFILAESMMVHQLDRRFAYSILSRPSVGKSPFRIFFALGAICAFISMWVSNTATTAMMYPIGLGILYTLSEMKGEDKKIFPKKYAVGMMLLVAYASSIGGIGTPVGTPPNLIGIGMIHKLVGLRISFFQWMLFAVPVMMVMYFFLYLLLIKLHPPETKELQGAAEYVQMKLSEMKGWTAGQRNSLIAFLVAVFLWVFPGFLAVIWGTGSQIYQWYNSHFPEGTVALLAASLLFFLPTNWKERKFTLSWKQAVSIDWGTILLFGGGLSLGSLMFSTKLAENLGQSIVHLSGATDLWTITAVSIFSGILISETTSNTASANMVIPVMIAIAKSAGVSPIPPALGACLGASMGFMLPISTPPNAIVYGSGMVPITKMIRAGVMIDFLGFLTIFLGLRILCPLLGLL
ncbi:MAG: DASS family sodium-coupled anion symporter [Candidatus Edwardsbacteria bacterium]